MDTPPYSKLAFFYNHIMQSINYKNWANYIFQLSHCSNGKINKVLELAAGNCVLANLLQNHFKNIFVCDKSIQMLNNAKQDNLSKVCCDMVSLPFNIEFDFIFSTFDSINYLTNEFLLNKFFKGIKSVISNEGCFTFDISLKNNSLKNVRDLNRTGEYEKIKYRQKSIYNESTQIHLNEFDIIMPDGKKYREIHKQRIYDFYFYFDVIEKNGLYVAECFDAFTFKDASPNSERAQFILKKEPE